jgi:hypothetical protein
MFPEEYAPMRVFAFSQSLRIRQYNHHSKSPSASGSRLNAHVVTWGKPSDRSSGDAAVYG